jgi:hypothetical protein
MGWQKTAILDSIYLCFPFAEILAPKNERSIDKYSKVNYFRDDDESYLRHRDPMTMGMMMRRIG